MEETLSFKPTRSRVFWSSRNTLLKSSALATESSSFQHYVSIPSFYKHSETELTFKVWDVSAFTLREWSLWLKGSRSWDSMMMAGGQDLCCHPGCYMAGLVPLRVDLLIQELGFTFSYSSCKNATVCRLARESFRVLAKKTFYPPTPVVQMKEV